MFGLNKITPTKDYYDTAVFHDTSNIDVNIIYDHSDFLQMYKNKFNFMGDPLSSDLTCV